MPSRLFGWDTTLFFLDLRSSEARPLERYERRATIQQGHDRGIPEPRYTPPTPGPLPLTFSPPVTTLHTTQLARPLPLHTRLPPLHDKQNT